MTTLNEAVCTLDVCLYGWSTLIYRWLILTVYCSVYMYKLAPYVITCKIHTSLRVSVLIN